MIPENVTVCLHSKTDNGESYVFSYIGTDLRKYSPEFSSQEDAEKWLTGNVLEPQAEGVVIPFKNP